MLQLPNTLSPKHLQLSFCSPRFIKDSDFSTQTHFSRQGPIAHILVWASFSLHGLFSMAAGPIPRLWGLNFRFSICMGCCEHMCVCVCVCVSEVWFSGSVYRVSVCVWERERKVWISGSVYGVCVCVCVCVCVGGLNFRFSVWSVSVYTCVRLRAVQVLCVTLGSTGVLPH